MNKRPLSILICVWALGGTAAQAVPATLKPIRGSVYVQHPNKDLWESVQTPMAVEEGDRIKTNNASDAFLILPDDHRIAIGEETYLILSHMAEGETKIYLKNGSIRNKVRHLQAELGQYYKIQTPAAVCAVRGTDFTVLQNPGLKTSEVHVFEGMVDFSALRADIAQAVTHVETGHFAAIDAGGNIQHVTAPPNSGTPPDPNPLPAHHDKDEGTMPTHHGPPPPGAGGPAWYDHPESIDPATFKPTSSLPTDQTPGTQPPIMAGYPNQPTNSEVPPNHAPPTYSFDPLSGTGISPGPGGNTPGGPTSINYNPPPAGNNPPTTSGTGSTDPATAGNQALFDTVRNMNFTNGLQNILVAGLFNDGSVKLSPIDGQWHLYADSIRQTGTNSVQFLNATMIYNQPGTLNYQLATINFNQMLPATASAYTIATQTAFQGWNSGASPGTLGSYFAQSIDNYRSNTVDYVDVQASASGLPQLDPVSNQYKPVYDSGRCMVNGTTLWTETAGTYSYLGGAMPTLSTSGSGNASIAWNNTYSNGTYLGRQVVYFDPSTGHIASPSTLPTTSSPAQYFGGTTLVAQDTLYSNLFTHGPIMSFASSQSRLLAGIDTILNDQSALSILNGTMPVGLPDGLITSSGKIHS